MSGVKYTKRSTPGLNDMAMITTGLYTQAFPERDNSPNEGLHIDFPNDLTLSLVWGYGAYARPTTVEVAVMRDKRKGWLTEKVVRRRRSARTSATKSMATATRSASTPTSSQRRTGGKGCALFLLPFAIIGIIILIALVTSN